MTTETLRTSKRVGNLMVHIGCTRWAVKQWIGNLYPQGTTDDDFAREYSKQLNTIEFGPTFYTSFSADDIRSRWTSKINGNPEFKICPKMDQMITHQWRLQNVEQRTEKFFDSLSGFGDHLGPILMQIGNAITPKYVDVLNAFLQNVPKGFQIFLEVRDEHWLSDSDARKQLFDILQKHNTGAVITDTPGRRDCVHMQLPTPHAMIRFVGNNGSQLEQDRLDAWVERIKQWSNDGLQSLWFFMHQHDELYAPYSCRYLIRRLNETLGLEIKGPAIYNEINT